MLTVDRCQITPLNLKIKGKLACKPNSVELKSNRPTKSTNEQGCTARKLNNHNSNSILSFKLLQKNRNSGIIVKSIAWMKIKKLINETSELAVVTVPKLPAKIETAYASFKVNYFK